MNCGSKIYLARLDREEFKDINEEFSLPDYMPEIKKVLTCCDNVSPPSFSDGSDSVMAEGECSVSVLYVGVDGKLYSVPFSFSYAFSFDADIKDPSSEFVVVSSQGLNAGAVSPRKISLRGKLRATAVFQSPALDDECITEETLPSMCESLYREVRYTDAEMSEYEITEISDDILSDKLSETSRIIMCESRVLVTDLLWGEEGVTVRGEVNTEILLSDDALNEVPSLLRRKTPFSSVVGGVEASLEQRLCARVFCPSSECSIENNSIHINVRCAISITSFCEKCENVCEDVYSPEFAIQPITSEISTLLPSLCISKNMSINASLKAEDVGMTDEQKLVCAFSDACFEDMNVNPDNGRESICGYTVFRLITVNDSGEENEYDCIVVKLPFKYDVSADMIDALSEKLTVLPLKFSTSRTLARFDGERLSLDTELFLSAVAFKKCTVKVVSGVIAGDKKEKNTGCIRIVYPQSGECLWSVAKRTDSYIKDLVSKNRIGEDALSDMGKTPLNLKYIVV